MLYLCKRCNRPFTEMVTIFEKGLIYDIPSCRSCDVCTSVLTWFVDCTKKDYGHAHTYTRRVLILSVGHPYPYVERWPGICICFINTELLGFTYAFSNVYKTMVSEAERVDLLDLERSTT